MSDSIAALPETERLAILDGLTEKQLEELLFDWQFWARADQLLPPGDWSTWVTLAGRGWGKTKTGAETTRGWACGSTPLSRGRYGRIALVAETAADARDVLVEGDSGILRCHPKAFRPYYEPSKRRLTWPNGTVATIYNATEPDQLRGPQHEAAWCDELAKWAKARETWDQLQFGLRLGSNPRVLVTTTPRPIPVLREILKDPTTFVTKGHTLDNRANLSERFIQKIYARHSGTRLGRQELEAEMLDDLPGALWLRSYFDPADGSRSPGRIDWKECPPFVRIVVAVDPSGTRGASDDGDSIGIVIAGLDAQNVGYVIADWSIKAGPADWARQAVDAYHHYSADRIIGEANYGGAMVEATIRAVDPMVSYSDVHASRGKVLRAEPVAALYEQGRVRHVNGANPRDEERLGLAPLEDQLCLLSPSGYAGDGSPDRADAAVWALTELMVDNSKQAGVLW